jgi:hypothetical protein
VVRVDADVVAALVVDVVPFDERSDIVLVRQAVDILCPTIYVSSPSTFAVYVPDPLPAS